ncbi:RICIN domain-containing protein [Candidatus Saccharibacteria bacterium]|nr:RICIN domain-containing protein [Candidatus Saccharibacteria bacterium]
MIEIDRGVRRRRDRRVWILLGGMFIAIALFTFLVQHNKVIDKDVKAANLAAFDPGYIISDYQMSNYNAMNESQIQAFLKSKNSCNDTNIGRYTAGEKVDYFSEMSPPRTWHVKDGHFVCMADEVFDGGTAAHIIHEAAQDYKINPQVLLVLLEKEQSLVRDTFPHSQQYRSATGYGCPDTAACSSKYYGLQNQIRNAAALFRTVLDGGWTNYPLGNNYVQYNPNAACGGSVVNIRNLATSALYRYTPYQPNAATLAGGSDGCSAYGNMNFYRYFEDWFGGIKEEELKIPESSDVLEGTYVLQSELDNKKVLDIDGGVKNAKNGTNIQLYEKNGTEAQQWKIQANDDGTYTIINPATKKVLDVEAGSKNDGANIQLYESNGTCAQRWKIVKGEADNYTIYSACSGRVIDVSAGNTANGTNIQIYTSNNTKAQKWKLAKK